MYHKCHNCEHLYTNSFKRCPNCGTDKDEEVSIEENSDITVAATRAVSKPKKIEIANRIARLEGVSVEEVNNRALSLRADGTPEGLIRALIHKLLAIEDHYMEIVQVAANHGALYKGPSYVKEMNMLCDLIQIPRLWSEGPFSKQIESARKDFREGKL